jgi:hypothetical protein
MHVGYIYKQFSFFSGTRKHSPPIDHPPHAHVPEAPHWSGFDTVQKLHLDAPPKRRPTIGRELSTQTINFTSYHTRSSHSSLFLRTPRLFNPAIHLLRPGSARPFSSAVAALSRLRGAALRHELLVAIFRSPQSLTLCSTLSSWLLLLATSTHALIGRPENGFAGLQLIIHLVSVKYGNFHPRVILIKPSLFLFRKSEMFKSGKWYVHLVSCDREKAKGCVCSGSAVCVCALTGHI